MIFSKACEYGIRATLYLAQQSHKNLRPNLKDIAKAIDSPEAFTAKILQELVKSKIVKSVKGASGGFEVDSKKIAKVKLKHIIMAIDKDFSDKLCVLGLKKCSELRPCPLHYKYKHVKADMNEMFNTTSLLDMSNSLKNGTSWLKL